MRGEIGLSYWRSEGQGRVFQGCNVRSAPALIHYGTSGFFFFSSSADSADTEIPRTFRRERSRRTRMSPEEPRLLRSPPARWTHQCGTRSGGNISGVSGIQRTRSAYFPSLVSSHERGSRMQPPPPPPLTPTAPFFPSLLLSEVENLK